MNTAKVIEVFETVTGKRLNSSTKKTLIKELEKVENEKGNTKAAELRQSGNGDSEKAQSAQQVRGSKTVS